MTGRKGFVPAFLLIVSLLVSQELAGSDFVQVSKDLAERIAALRPRPDSIVLTTRQGGSGDPAELRQIQRLLEQEFRARRLNLAENSAAVTVVISLGEGLKGRILIAEIQRAEQPDVIILPVPGAAPTRRVSLEKSLLWRQKEPILDFVFLGDRLWILSPGRISRMDNSEQGWKEQTTWSLDGTVPLPRDPRGRLFATGAEFQAFLPGLECQGSAETGGRVDCQVSDRGFPAAPSDPSGVTIRLKAGRNYFDQLLTPDGPPPEVPPFYAAAPVSGVGGAFWGLSTLDGVTRIFNSRFSEVGRVAGSTGGLASAEAAECGSWFLVVSESEDGQEALQAFQWSGDRPVEGSEPLEFDGLVTALWPDGGNRARVVERDLKSGRYAAWSVALVCAD